MESACGKDDSGTIHEVWSCSALRPLQLQADEDLDLLNCSNTPMHILLGLPTHLQHEYDCGFLSPLRAIAYRSTATCSTTLAPCSKMLNVFLPNFATSRVPPPTV